CGSSLAGLTWGCVRPRRPEWRSAMRASVLPLLALAFVATASSAQELGTVSGKVTYKGKPLTAGVVGVWSAGGAVQVPLNADGTYELTRVRPGDYSVTVSTEAIKGKPGYVAIPPKYGKLATTPLKFRVTREKEVLDIKLD